MHVRLDGGMANGAQGIAASLCCPVQADGADATRMEGGGMNSYRSLHSVLLDQ